MTTSADQILISVGLGLVVAMLFCMYMMSLEDD